MFYIPFMLYAISLRAEGEEPYDWTLGPPIKNIEED